jgi:hypothetical protein
MRPIFTTFSIFTLVAVLAASPVAAQDSRADEIARQQAEKSKQLRPNVATGGEKALNWFEAHFNDPSTVYLTFGGVYPSAGFAPGIAARGAFGHARVDVGAAYSIRSYKAAHASLGFPELAGDKLDVGTRVRWTDATQVPFYGVGNETSKDDRVNYGLRALEAGANATFKPVRWYRVGGGVALRNIEDREGAGTRPSIDTFAGPTPPGLFNEVRYTDASVFTAIDYRESSGYTRRGGLYSVTFHDLKDSDDNFGFRRIDAEVQQFIPLLKEHWVIALRGLVHTTDVDDQQVVPYYLLPTLGGAHLHRGYSDFRFQDRNVLLVSGEYRWIPSRILDVALFVDAGKVTRERRDLDFDRLKTAYGIGFRIHGPTFTPLRFDIAHAKEGLRLHITGGVPF